MIIEEFEPDVFRQLIEYIHTGCVTLQARTLLGKYAWRYEHAVELGHASLPSRRTSFRGRLFMRKRERLIRKIRSGKKDDVACFERADLQSTDTPVIEAIYKDKIHLSRGSVSASAPVSSPDSFAHLARSAFLSPVFN